MKEIKLLAGMIREELEDAEKYAKQAMCYKDTNKRLGDLFVTLSKQELDHANLEHDQAVYLIREQTEKPPEAMQAVWDWEHERMVEQSSKVRQLLEMYKA